MTKSVSRIVVVVVALASTLAFFSVVDAQTYAPIDPVVRGATYEPPVATANNGFLGFSDINPVAGEATGGTGGGDASTAAGLAITGSEANLGLAVGIGLLAVGGTAVVASRKRDQE